MTSHPSDQLVDDVCRRAAEIHGDVRCVVTAEVDRLAPLFDDESRAVLVNRAVARLDGLDALEEILADPAVDEVMVNGGREVWVDRAGMLSRCNDLERGAVEVVLERVLAPLGKRLDRTSPIVDARLADGARLCAVVAPIAQGGTAISIRRHGHRRVPIADFGAAEVVELLDDLVDRRANVLITGATSSGKTTFLSSLAGRVSANERLVCLEDTSELDLADRHHVVRLEARPAGVDGVAPIDMSNLVRTALRLRPDRLIIGEFRGAEVIAVVEALNTGHDGSLSTCHANGAIDGLRRVETLVMQSAPSWPLAAIRRQVSRSLDAIVHLRRDARGHRAIVEVVEVVESDGEPGGRPLVADGVRVDSPRRSRR